MDQQFEPLSLLEEIPGPSLSLVGVHTHIKRLSAWQHLFSFAQLNVITGTQFQSETVTTLTSFMLSNAKEHGLIL